MNKKRILSLIVALAMVMTVIPMFGLVASADEVITYNSSYYKVTGSNLVTDGGFTDSEGNFSMGDWFSPSNGVKFAEVCENYFYMVDRDANTATLYSVGSSESIDGATDYALGTRWNDGSQGLCSLGNNVAVEAGKTYYIAFDYKHKSSNVDMGYIQTSFVTSATYSTDGTNLGTPAATTTDWQTAKYVYTPESDGYIFFHFRWLGEGSNAGNGPYFYFDNFTVEEVEDITTSVEISYTCDGTPVATETYSGYVGQEITLPETVSDGTTIYTVDNTTYTLTSATTDTVSVTASASVVIESVANVATAAFEGTLVTLPSTVTASYNDGTSADLAVTWNAVDAGNAEEITGTVEGYDGTVTATITRYAVTNTMDDINVNQANQKIALPATISGDYAIEFTYAPTQLDNNWFYISNTENGMFGEGVGFGTDGSTDDASEATVYARYGNGGTANLDLATVAVGETYRVMVVGNAADGTYDISFTSSDGTIQAVTGVTERSASTAATLAYLCVGADNQGGVFDVTDIKLNYPVHDITVKYVCDETTVKSETIEDSTMAVGDTYTVTANTIVDKYYVTTNSATVADDYTVSIGLTALPDVFTIRSGALYETNFDAYNWGEMDSQDRVGFATLDVPTGTVGEAQSYALTGTSNNYNYNNYSGNNGLAIYAISTEELAELDLTDTNTAVDYVRSKGQEALIVEGTAPKTFLNDYYTDGTWNFPLNKTAITTAAGESGKVVLVGLSHHGLMGISGEDIALTISDLPAEVAAEISYVSAEEAATSGVAEDTLVIEVEAKYAKGATATVTAEYSANSTGVAVGSATVDSNDYVLAVVPKNANVVYTVTFTEGETTIGSVTTSLYSLLLNDIVANLSDYKSATALARVEQAVAALTEGGVVYTDSLDSQRSQFITATTDETAGTTTISIDEDLYDLGLGFKVGVYAGVDGTGKAVEGTGDTVYQTITVNTTDGTVTVQGDDGVVLTFDLDAVELEFVDEAALEDEADAPEVDTELVFDEIM